MPATHLFLGVAGPCPQHPQWVMWRPICWGEEEQLQAAWSGREPSAGTRSGAREATLECPPFFLFSPRPPPRGPLVQGQRGAPDAGVVDGGRSRRPAPSGGTERPLPRHHICALSSSVCHLEPVSPNPTNHPREHRGACGLLGARAPNVASASGGARGGRGARELRPLFL